MLIPSGTVEDFSKKARTWCRELFCQQLTGMVKKVIQQGHSPFDARSELPVRAVRQNGENAAGGFFQHSPSTFMGYLNIFLALSVNLKEQSKNNG